MSLDQTLTNVNDALNRLTTDVSQLLDVLKVAILLLFVALSIMVIGLTILCFYVKCKKTNNLYGRAVRDPEAGGILKNNGGNRVQWTTVKKQSMKNSIEEC